MKKLIKYFGLVLGSLGVACGVMFGLSKTNVVSADESIPTYDSSYMYHNYNTYDLTYNSTFTWDYLQSSYNFDDELLKDYIASNTDYWYYYDDDCNGYDFYTLEDYKTYCSFYNPITIESIDSTTLDSICHTINFIASPIYLNSVYENNYNNSFNGCLVIGINGSDKELLGVSWFGYYHQQVDEDGEAISSSLNTSFYGHNIYNFSSSTIQLIPFERTYLDDSGEYTISRVLSQLSIDYCSYNMLYNGSLYITQDEYDSLESQYQDKLDNLQQKYNDLYLSYNPFSNCKYYEYNANLSTSITDLSYMIKNAKVSSEFIPTTKQSSSPYVLNSTIYCPFYNSDYTYTYYIIEQKGLWTSSDLLYISSVYNRISTFGSVNFLDSTGSLLYSYNQDSAYSNGVFDMPISTKYIIFELQDATSYLDFTLNTDYSNAYTKGFNDGLDDNSSFDKGYEEGKIKGKAEGIAEASQSSNTALSFFDLILSYPVNFVKQVFNFEIFGINLSGAIMFILSLSIVGGVIWFILGKRK